MLILHAPLEIGVAVVFGLLWGVLITYLPAQPRPSPFIRKVCITHYPLLITHSPLPTTHHSLFTTHYS